MPVPQVTVDVKHSIAVRPAYQHSMLGIIDQLVHTAIALALLPVILHPYLPLFLLLHTLTHPHPNIYMYLSATQLNSREKLEKQTQRWISVYIQIAWQGM